MQQFEFAPIYKIEDVTVGMIVPGIVTNITRFGAFIDIGVKQDGLVHVSEIAHRYITDPNEAVKLNDKVMVKVLEVDIPRKRIALSIKQASEAPKKPEGRNKVKDSRGPLSVSRLVLTATANPAPATAPSPSHRQPCRTWNSTTMQAAAATYPSAAPRDRVAANPSPVTIAIGTNSLRCLGNPTANASATIATRSK